MRTKKIKHPPPIVIGWRERIDLPELGYVDLPAKIDTGARTSALHAQILDRFTKDGADWVRFKVPAHRHLPARVHEFPVHDAREIKNTSGVPELRVVIHTTFTLGDRTWHIDLSLTDRSNMKHALIVGRASLSRHAIAVHTGRSFLTRGKPASLKKQRTKRDEEE